MKGARWAVSIARSGKDALSLGGCNGKERVFLLSLLLTHGLFAISPTGAHNGGRIGDNLCPLGVDIGSVIRCFVNPQDAELRRRAQHQFSIQLYLQYPAIRGNFALAGNHRLDSRVTVAEA